MEYTHRYIARITLEATTPLAVGSGLSSLSTDATVIRDFNELPYIPGTSLTGILRAGLDDKLDASSLNNLFGSLEQIGKDEWERSGSRITISDAYLIGDKGKVLQAITPKDEWPDIFNAYLELPVREHVRITAKGSAALHGKFDQEVVYKGSRFTFEIELQGSSEDKSNWNALLDIINADLFLVGGSQTKGFGLMKTIENGIAQKVYDLTNENDLKDYLDLSPDLNTSIGISQDSPPSKSKSWEKKSVKLNMADALFHFGSGYGSSFADASNYQESEIIWDDHSQPKLSDPCWVIPGTSIKGVLAHRIAYEHNFKKEINVENIFETIIPQIISENIQEEIEKLMKNKLGETLNTVEMEEEAARIKDWLMNEKLSQSSLEKELDEIIKHREYLMNHKKKQQEYLDKLDELKEKLKLSIETKENFSEYVEENIFNSKTGEMNDAVFQLFGRAKDQKDITKLFRREKDKDKLPGKMGAVIFLDIYVPKKDASEHILDHNAIDRFTGGTIDTALFNEEALLFKNELTLEYCIKKDIPHEFSELFTTTITSLLKGHIPIGGKNSKGHGFFTSKID